MNPQTLDRGAEVLEASSGDLYESLRRELDRCGLTFDQLAEQAQDSNFESLDARLAWVAIGDLREVLTDGSITRPSQ